MTSLTDLSLAIVGFLTISSYGVLLVLGAMPEQALLVALGGGLAVGLLVSFSVHVVAGNEDGPHPLAPSPAPLARGKTTGAARSAASAPSPLEMERGQGGEATPTPVESA